MADSKVVMCKCKSAYQDKKYGKGKRVHNYMKGKGTDEYRCTVCGDVKR